MKNKNIIALIVVVVVLIALGLTWNASQTGSSSQNQNASSTNAGGEMQTASSTTSSQPSSATNGQSKPSKPSTGTASGANSGPTANPPVYACTMEAKICPDGSAVGRSGPKCEFTACPGEASGAGTSGTGSGTSGSANTQTSTSLNQTIIIGGVYITPTKVVSDSRCPVDVTCVWAGEVKLAVHLEKKVMGQNNSADVIFTSGTAVNFQGSNISLVDVQPQQKSKSSILDKDYVFTFKVN